MQNGLIRPLLVLITVLLSSIAPQLCIWLLLRKCPLNKAELVRVKVLFLSSAVEPEQAGLLHSVLFVSVSVNAVAQWQAVPGQSQVTAQNTTARQAAGELQNSRHTCSAVDQVRKNPVHAPATYLTLVLQWINQQSIKAQHAPYRVFCVSARLYIFNTDLSAFLPLDDMPSNMPQQIWSAVQDLTEIDAGTALTQR